MTEFYLFSLAIIGGLLIASFLYIFVHNPIILVFIFVFCILIYYYIQWRKGKKK